MGVEVDEAGAVVVLVFSVDEELEDFFDPRESFEKSLDIDDTLEREKMDF